LFADSVLAAPARRVSIKACANHRRNDSMGNTSTPRPLYLRRVGQMKGGGVRDVGQFFAGASSVQERKEEKKR